MHVSPIGADLSLAIRLALRARFGSIFFWLLIALVIVVWMAAQFSARQPATVALDVGLSVIRLVLPFISVFLLQELLSQEFARRLFLTSMTYPRPRYQFLLGRFLAVALLVLALLVVLSAVLAGLVALIGEGYDQSTPVALDYRYAITVAFMAVDIVVIIALGTLLAITAATPSFVLIGTLGFTLVARSFSAIVALIEYDTTLVDNPDAYQLSLSLLGYILPDLGALDVRMIALYSNLEFFPSDWAVRIGASSAYAIGLLSIAVWAFNRKRFR